MEGRPPRPRKAVYVREQSPITDGSPAAPQRAWVAICQVGCHFRRSSPTRGAEPEAAARRAAHAPRRLRLRWWEQERLERRLRGAARGEAL